MNSEPFHCEARTGRRRNLCELPPPPVPLDHRQDCGRSRPAHTARRYAAPCSESRPLGPGRKNTPSIAVTSTSLTAKLQSMLLVPAKGLAGPQVAPRGATSCVLWPRQALTRHVALNGTVVTVSRPPDCFRVAQSLASQRRSELVFAVPASRFPIQLRQEVTHREYVPAVDTSVRISDRAATAYYSSRPGGLGYRRPRLRFASRADRRW